MTTVLIEVDGVSGSAELDDSMECTRRFLASLPIEARLTHGSWSGMTCELPVRVEAAGGGLEVIGLLPGSIALDVRHQRVLVAYGNAESRTALGPHYVARIGELTAGRRDILAVLDRMHEEGDKPINIRAAAR